MGDRSEKLLVVLRATEYGVENQVIGGGNVVARVGNWWM